MGLDGQTFFFFFFFIVCVCRCVCVCVCMLCVLCVCAVTPNPCIYFGKDPIKSRTLVFKVINMNDKFLILDTATYIQPYATSGINRHATFASLGKGNSFKDDNMRHFPSLTIEFWKY